VATTLAFIGKFICEEAMMSNLIPIDPFDDVFKGFFKPVKFEGVPDIQIKIDVKEDEQTYTVHADIPGAKKEDIHVSLDGNLVSISAEVKQEKEVKKGEKVLRSERYYGKVERKFSLENEVDESKANAKYADGVLELKLPKKPVQSSKRIQVQ
jgi:HSP20 family protein